MGPKRRFQATPYLAVTVGHLTIDVFNSMGPVLVAFLRQPMALSAAQVGLAVGSYQFLAGVTQPPFGFLADRIGSRWLGPSSLVWTIGFVALAVFAADAVGSYWLFLGLFAIGALGSGAFHPQGTMHASRAIAGRAATTTAIFFLCGQIGLAGGPAMTGALLERVGPKGVYWLAVLALPTVVLMALGLRSTKPSPHPHLEQARGRESRDGGSAGVVALLVVIFTCRGWTTIGTSAFLPAIFAEAGFSPTYYGLVTGLFWLGAGFSGVAAGHVADRLGRRPVVAVTTLLGAVLLVPLPVVGAGWAFALAFLTGGFLGAAHSILIVMAQSFLPVRQGLASGLALGYLFGIGAVASVLIGLLADRWGLVPVIQAGAARGLLAALLTVLLPASRHEAGQDDPGVAPEAASV
ncbi:MAG: MFS transporter [Acidobacteriota bacterium]|nr:MFS transporter [Acidobacteriota bacterium]